MKETFIKNIPIGEALNLASTVEYQAGRVVSLTLSQNENLTLTLFAFAKGEGVSTHSAPGDAMAYILDGQAEISVGANKFSLQTGETIVMPANVPHGLEATENFKLLLILVKN